MLSSINYKMFSITRTFKYTYIAYNSVQDIFITYNTLQSFFCVEFDEIKDRSLILSKLAGVTQIPPIKPNLILEILNRTKE